MITRDMRLEKTHNRLVRSSSLRGATIFQKARREIYGPLSFLVRSISCPKSCPVSSNLLRACISKHVYSALTSEQKIPVPKQNQPLYVS